LTSSNEAKLDFLKASVTTASSSIGFKLQVEYKTYPPTLQDCKPLIKIASYLIFIFIYLQREKVQSVDGSPFGPPHGQFSRRTVAGAGNVG
jgi:hypothetical protein